MNADLEKRRAKARLQLPENASAEMVDREVLRVMARNIRLLHKLYLEAAEARRLSLWERRHRRTLALLEAAGLIEAEEHLLVLTERGREFLRDFRSGGTRR